MSRVEDTLDRFGAMPFLSLLNVITRKTQVIENPVSIRPLSKKIIVFEEMIVAKCGVRNHQRLHRHGIFFHDIADTRIGVDDNLVSKALQTLPVEGLVVGEALAEAPMPIHQ